MSTTDTGTRLQRRAVVFAGLLLLAFVIVMALRWRDAHQLERDTRATAAAVPLVDVTTVQGGAAADHLTLPGETSAWYQSTIYSRVSGYVAKWYADIGDHVVSGQLLATIDTPELDAELGASRAKLQVAEAQVRVKQADADFASTTYARWRDSPKGVVSEQEREDKRAGNVAAGAQLEAAKAEVKLDQADVDRLSAFEQFKRVTAPYAGTITQRQIDIGNLVTAGSAVSTTSLYRMSQDDPIRIFVEVPQSAAKPLMKVGVPADVLSGDDSPPLRSKIARTSEAIDPRARTFRAEIDLANSTHVLVPGMYVQVRFQLPSNGLLQVPAAALIFSAAGPEVAVVDVQSAVRFHPVTIARDDGDEVELSSGVAAGERLVLNISNQIVSGQRVQVAGQPGDTSVAKRGS